MPAHLPPAQAAALDRRLLELRRDHLVSPQEFVVLHYVLWHARPKGADSVQVALTTICDRTGARREDAVSALRKAQEHGLLTAIKDAGRWLWIEGKRVFRKLCTIYIWRTSAVVTESVRRTASMVDSIPSVTPFVKAKAMERFHARYPDYEAKMEAAFQRIAAATGMTVPT